MKKIYFLVLSLLIASVGIAQTEIDKVNSDSSAMALFRSQVIRGNAKSNFNDFKLTDGTEWANFYNFNDEQKNRILSQYKYQNWAKLDLNNDKKNDLIISGYLSKTVGHSNHYRMFIFLTNPQNNTIDFVKYNSATPQYFRIVNLDTSKYMEISRWVNDMYKSADDLPLRIDTVQFQPSLLLLIDREKLVEPNNIKKVTYKETYNLQNTLEAVVTNNGTRAGDFSIRVTQQSQSKPVINNAKISTDLMKDFLDITRRLKKYDIKEGNPIMSGDAEVKKSVEVEYTDGSKMFIEDNAGTSSYTLSAVYSWFEYSINNVYEQIAEREYYNNNNNYYYDPFGW